MARFHIKDIRRFAVGKYEFQDHYLTIPDSNPTAIADFKKKVSTLPPYFTDKITEIAEKDLAGNPIVPDAPQSNVVRGIQQAITGQKEVDGSLAGQLHQGDQNGVTLAKHDPAHGKKAPADPGLANIKI